MQRPAKETDEQHGNRADAKRRSPRPYHWTFGNGVDEMRFRWLLAEQRVFEDSSEGLPVQEEQVTGSDEHAEYR